MRIPRQYAVAFGITGAVLLLLGLPYLSARLSYVFAPSGEVADSTGGDASPSAPEIGTPNFLSIPSLGIEAPLQYVTEKSEESYQAALRHGVVHYPGTALPGEFGNVYIFGHSSDFVWAPGGYKTVFALLPEIEQDAEIQVSDSEGRIYRYRVMETKVVGPRDLSVLDQFNNEKKMLTLQTSYPLGTALQRYIVLAELDESTGE